MDGPALLELLKDIKAGKIDTVVVYKIDRLTRSLTDFSKMVEVFDRHEVSFVSVTQQFNTTTSMGRLTLNVPLSFAQFEREVTAERIVESVLIGCMQSWLEFFHSFWFYLNCLDVEGFPLRLLYRKRGIIRGRRLQDRRAGCFSQLFSACTKWRILDAKQNSRTWGPSRRSNTQCDRLDSNQCAGRKGGRRCLEAGCSTRNWRFASNDGTLLISRCRADIYAN